MKKFLILLLSFSLFCGLLLHVGASESADTENKHLSFTGIIKDATDIDGDGFLDKNGNIEIRIILSGPLKYVDVVFSEKDFSCMAYAEGEEKQVCTRLGSYAENTVVTMEYYGDPSLMEKSIFYECDLDAIKKCFLSACKKNGVDVSDTVFPLGNEIYDSSNSDESISLFYDNEGNVALTYKGESYSVAKKFGIKNTLFITEGGNAFPLSELENKIKSAAEGEMLALFGDIDGDGRFDIMDIKSCYSFAPFSAEWNAAAGAKGAAFSYVLFDREVRLSAPSGRTFSAKNAEGSGLSVAIANEKGEYRFSSPALCYDKHSGEYVRFGAVRSAKITDAEETETGVKVTFEGGEEILLPTAQMLTEEMETELFFEVSGAIGSKTLTINSKNGSWYSSLASFYEQNGSASLEGKTATAVFAADGTAIYVEINE